ncbi:MAG: hypothetical protein IKD72_07040 [Clostridia bacterium]|nr:hypothetical protein [Clostridia bacterium]
MKKATLISKRMLSVLLAAMMMLSCFAVAASAAELYKLDDSNCVLDKEKKWIIVTGATVSIGGEDKEVSFFITPEAVKDELKTGETKFSELQTGKTYTIVGKVGDEIVTNAKTIQLLNSKPAPAEPIPEKLTATEITVKAVSGCEYQLENQDGTVKQAWSATRAFTGLTPDTRYKVSIRYAEVANTYYASPASTITVKTLKAAAGTAPVPELKDKTNTTIAVKAVSGVEYSLDKTTWNTTGEFTGLKPATPYEVYARYVFNKDEQAESPISAPTKITTNAKERYEASMDKTAFAVTTKGDLYAGNDVKFKVTGDVPKDLGALQYGDTRYIPVSFTTSQGGSATGINPSSAASVETTTKPSEGGDLIITVTFRQDRYNGSTWVSTGENQKKDFSVSIHGANDRGRVTFTKIINFFTNGLPKAIANVLGSDAMKNAFNTMMKLVKNLLGALTK